MAHTSVGVRAEIKASGEVGLLLPLLGDHHAHLQLVDIDELVSGGGGSGRPGARGSSLGFVLDLGGHPRELSAAAESLGEDPDVHLTVGYAGQFLSAPGGYPSDRSWAPAGSVRFVSSADDAVAAVAEQLGEGASIIKVTLHADAGPILDLDTIESICTTAHRHRVSVVAHAEGAGMTELALNGGVDALAHTPFTEVLDADVIEACARRGMTWISTFDIHGYGSPDAEQQHHLGVALDNAAHFVEAGGHMLYGTDLGNGPVPARVNAREIALLHEIGLDAQSILLAMSSDWLTRHTSLRVPHDWGSFVAVDEDFGGTPDDLISALTLARTITHDELVSYDD